MRWRHIKDTVRWIIYSSLILSHVPFWGITLGTYHWIDFPDLLYQLSPCLSVLFLILCWFFKFSNIIFHLIFWSFIFISNASTFIRIPTIVGYVFLPVLGNMCCYCCNKISWAIEGKKDRETCYQIWCGPGIGAYNEWVKGAYLERIQN